MSDEPSEIEKLATEKLKRDLQIKTTVKPKDTIEISQKEYEKLQSDREAFEVIVAEKFSEHKEQLKLKFPTKTEEIDALEDVVELHNAVTKWVLQSEGEPEKHRASSGVVPLQQPKANILTRQFKNGNEMMEAVMKERPDLYEKLLLKLKGKKAGGISEEIDFLDLFNVEGLPRNYTWQQYTRHKQREYEEQMKAHKKGEK